MEVEKWDYSELKERGKKQPLLGYINMRHPIDKELNPWIEDYRKAFKLLDKDNEYNIHILLKADTCMTDKKSIKIQNLKKIVIIDK